MEILLTILSVALSLTLMIIVSMASLGTPKQRAFKALVMLVIFMLGMVSGAVGTVSVVRSYVEREAFSELFMQTQKMERFMLMRFSALEQIIMQQNQRGGIQRADE